MKKKKKEIVKREIMKLAGKKIVFMDDGIMVFDKNGKNTYNVAMIPYNKLRGQSRWAYHCVLMNANVDNFSFLGYTYDSNGRKFCFYDMTLCSKEEREIIREIRRRKLANVVDVKIVDKTRKRRYNSVK